MVATMDGGLGLTGQEAEGFRQDNRADLLYGSVATVKDTYGMLKIFWESVCLVSVRTTTHQVDGEEIRGAGALNSSSGLRASHRVKAGPRALHGERQG